MLYIVIHKPKGNTPETYTLWSKADTQYLIDLYGFTKKEITIFDKNGNKVTDEFTFDK